MTWDDVRDADRSVTEVISRIAAAHPDVAALRDAGGEISYRELEAATDRLSHHLRTLGVDDECGVGIAVRRSVAAIVAFVGVLKAGGAFVPLDPDDPTPRLDLMLDDTDARVIVCEPGAEEAMRRFGRPVVVLGADLVVPDGDPDVALRGDPSARSLAYVMYTSGSTGRPKGVAIEHRGIIARIRGAQPLMPEVGEAMLQVSELDFDANTWEIWSGLLNGATMVIAPPGRPDPRVIRDLLEQNEVRVALLSPGLFHQMVEQDDAAPKGLRLLLAGGDVMSPTHARRFADANPDVPLVNLYGPTEVTVCCTWHEVKALPPGRAVPIGRPLGNTTLHVLDADGREVDPGEAGELYIGGPAVAREYLNLPDATAERFVAHPFVEGEAGRLYRSGDLVRWRPDGELDFLGRIDEQVKIRGFRIEPGEVEAELHGVTGVRQAAVIAREDIPGHKRLVAYLVMDEVAVAADTVRDELASRVPPHLVPSAFVLLDALPLTARGKVDDGALRALPPPTAQDGGRPSTPTEVDIAQIWADVLHLPQVGVDDDFLALGGDSLLAIRILAGVERRFGLSLPVGAVLEQATIARLAALVDLSLEGGTTEQLPPLERDFGPAGPVPVTSAQAMACVASEVALDALPYQFQAVIHFRGGFEKAVLDRALTEIMRRHEALRTRFPKGETGWLQVVEPPPEVCTPLVDLTGEPDPEAAWTARSEQIFRERIAIDQVPLVRWTVLRVRPDHHVLVHVEHHLVHDGWSWAVLLRELVTLYRAFAAGAPSPLPELPVQYTDFTRWQEAVCDGPAGKAQVEYWREVLRDLPSPALLPTDRPRPPRRSYRGDQLVHELDPFLAARLRVAAREHGATLFAFMLSGYFALLHRLTGGTDLIVGSGIANRRSREAEDLIGMLLNTVAIRVDTSDDPTVRELVARCRSAALGAFANGDVPFERVLEAVRPDRRAGELPVYQTLFSFQDPMLPDLTLDGVVMEPDDSSANRSAKADLNLIILNRRTQHEDCRPSTGEVTVLWEYATDLFDETTAQAMLRSYVSVLDDLATNPDARLSDLRLTDPGDAAASTLLPGEERPYERETSISEVFAARVAERPDAVAIEDGDASLTYRELDAWAGHVAAELAAWNVAGGSPVAVVMDRSMPAIVALLGVLDAGGAYVALDPSHPLERNRELLAACGAVAVCTDAANESVVRSLAGALPVVVVGHRQRTDAAPKPGRADTGPTDLAYIAFTSGSTGTAKGVAVPHRAVLRLVRNQDFVELSPDERVLCLAPLAFDASTFELWGPLLNGGTIVVAPASPEPETIAEVVRSHAVTTMWLTAGLFHQVVDSCPGMLAGVRQVLAGGDVLSPPHVQRALDLLPAGGVLVNGYGPTEGTTFTCCHRMPAGSVVGGTVPIGVPIANTRAYVLDELGRPASEGVVGELYAGGDGVALGYVGRPDLTAESFLPDPFAPGDEARMYRTGDLVRRRDGVLEFVGRVDDQVKLRGFRVEPGEVEHRLRAVAGVRDAVVVVRGATTDDRYLVAYVVLDPTEVTLAGLRSILAARVPSYLVPSRWVELDTLPLTENGKVDRAALPDVDLEEGEDEPPPRGNLLEQRLIEIWQDVLGVRPVRPDDDFFDLGGHSLVAIEMFAAIERVLGPRLPLATIFEAPTVAELADRVRAEGWEAPWSSLVPLRTGDGPPFFCLSAGDGNTVGYGALARRIRPGQAFTALQPRGLDGRRLLHTSVEAMASHYVDEVRSVQGDGPYLLGGRCLGGVVAYEMARQLELAGHHVALVVVLDSIGPRWAPRQLADGTPFDEVMNLAAVARRRSGSPFEDLFSPAGTAAFLDWLRETSVEGDAAVTRYLHQAYLARPDVQAAYPDLRGGDASRLVDWAWVAGRPEMGLNEQLLPSPSPAAADLHPPRRGPSRGAVLRTRLLERGGDWFDVATRGRRPAMAQRRHDRLQAIASAAVDRYRAGAFSGRVTLLRTDEFRDHVDLARWHGLDVAGVDERRVEGSHRSMLREPDVASLAATLQDCIDEASGG